jgi:hypothetical protein
MDGWIQILRGPMTTAAVALDRNLLGILQLFYFVTLGVGNVIIIIGNQLKEVSYLYSIMFANYPTWDLITFV